ncbi:hypothetical protein HMSSN139_09500 [Paenibacillus sp. HMSSN-139]|nr:hypothetical protein HMSSN139_09500 [Paenibacillus sp. HMSSN-139]
MNIIWTLLLLALSTGSGAAPQEQAAGNEPANSMMSSVAHTFSVNLAEGRLDNPIKPSDLKADPQADAPKSKAFMLRHIAPGDLA